MAQPDMSPKAVTVRLMRTAQLRRLCLQLRPNPNSAPEQPTGGDSARPESRSIPEPTIQDRTLEEPHG